MSRKIIPIIFIFFFVTSLWGTAYAASGSGTANVGDPEEPEDIEVESVSGYNVYTVSSWLLGRKETVEVEIYNSEDYNYTHLFIDIFWSKAEVLQGLAYNFTFPDVVNDTSESAEYLVGPPNSPGSYKLKVLGWYRNDDVRNLLFTYVKDATVSGGGGPPGPGSNDDDDTPDGGDDDDIDPGSLPDESFSFPWRGTIIIGAVGGVVVFLKKRPKSINQLLKKKKKQQRKRGTITRTEFKRSKNNKKPRRR